MRRDVFISYCSENREPVNRICAHLERDGISCWLAPRDIPPGQEWAAAISTALRNCRTLLLVLSSHSSHSKQIAREVQIADRNGLTIVTFRLENVEPPSNLEYFLTNLQWIDSFEGQFEAALNSVVETVRQTIVLPAVPPPIESSSPAAGPPSGIAPALSPSEPVNTPPTATRPAFDTLELERLKQVLAVHVGAMARIIVDQAAKNANTWDQLYKWLSKELPAGEERKRFLESRQR